MVHDQIFFGPGLNTALMSLKNRGDLIPEPTCGSSKSIWNYIGIEVYNLSINFDPVLLVDYSPEIGYWYKPVVNWTILRFLFLIFF